MPDLSIGLALVTRNRPASLERCLRCLTTQSEWFDELVISDDSDGALAAETRALAVRFGARYVRGPRRGLYANRNRSVLACRTTHVRTVDDDHEFPPDHFRICRDAVGSEPWTCWMIGEFPSWEEARAGIPPGPPPQLLCSGVSGPPASPEDYWGIADGAAIYPRALFENGLRFFEPVRMGAAYLEFGSRLRALGVRIRHLENTWVVHHHEPRQFDDPAHELAARTFAALCHGLLYAPTPRNVFWSTAYVVSYAFRRGGGVKPVVQGVQWFLERRREHLAWLRKMRHAGAATWLPGSPPNRADDRG